MRPDGSSHYNLTSGADLSSPVWSPDGTQIAYGYAQKYPTVEHALYRIDVASTYRTKVVDVASLPIGIAWSPDGQWLVFDNQRDIFVVRADGTSLTQLTLNTGFNTSPDWSPDGSQIVFSSDRLGSSGIYLMKPDGSAQQLIGPSGVHDIGPKWSPDGTQIVFTQRLTGTSMINVMQANGTGEHTVVSLGTVIGDPTWSPDGQTLLFEQWSLRYPSLYRIGVDGSGLTNLGGGYAPDWTP